MEIETCIYFINIVESRSFTAAAEKSNISQPALSNKIKSLEDELSTKLIVSRRGRHEIELTLAGEIFLQKARAMVEQYKHMQAEIEQSKHYFVGSLRLSIASAYTTSIQTNYLAPFIKENPLVKLDIFEGGSLDIVEENLLQQKAELGITVFPLKNPDSFEILYRKEETLYAICAKTAPYLNSNLKRIAFKDLLNKPLIFPKGTENIVNNIMASLSMSPKTIASISNRTSAINWARLGHGIAIVPLCNMDNRADDLIYCPIETNSPTTYQAIIKLPDTQLSKVANNFLQFYQQLSKYL